MFFPRPYPYFYDLLLSSTRHSLGRISAAAALLLSLLGTRVEATTIPFLLVSREPICPSSLSTKIEAITNRPQFRRFRWGILIQTQFPQQQTLYSHDSQAYFIPASNVKLLTTAAALLKHGPQWRLRTSMFQVGSQPTPVVLKLVGQGDPSFTEQTLRQLGQQLFRRGVRRIDQLILEDRSRPEDVINPTWEWEDIQAGYGAPVNRLILNQNAIALQLVPQRLGQPLQVVWENPADSLGWTVVNQAITVATDAPEFVEVGRDLKQPTLLVRGQLRVGSPSEPMAIAVVDPGQQFLRHLQRALRAEQITVLRTSFQGLDPAIGTEVAAVESPPLTQLLVETNQASNNLYAEVLVRSLADGTLTAGLRTLKTLLTQRGVDPQGYELRDGSGLSRHNLVSPEALVQTLQAMAQTTDAALYRASLPTGGINGTLQNRFQDRSVQGMLQAKTGTLTGVVALSGYLNNPHYHPLVFSILVNQSTAPTVEVQRAIDEIILLLARLQPC